MRTPKKPAIAIAGLSLAGAMALACGGARTPPLTATPHHVVAGHVVAGHVVAGHAGDGCDSWGDCWDTWGGGGDWGW
ncbi:hypothetical protein GCM10023196_104430 [Actinoallomurus vinaceus]|uniref:Lipoprotein n=1 Tax=Actinoallomurus vinaceus TaxID=1080074 RepID=A0ABP8UVK8_9ACTN